MNCVTTYVGGDRFAKTIPLYIYCIKTAYPDVYVKVFIRDVLPESVGIMLSFMKTMPELDNNWEVIEHSFDEIPARVSSCNSLRLLLPAKEFMDFKYVYVTDADMIITRQKKSHWDYYAEAMASCRTCFAAVGGAKLKPKRPQINGDEGWTGDYTRINNTMFMIRSPQWFEQTKNAREYYYKHLRNLVHDEFDTHVPMSYREYDEVMHYRILKRSGLPVPTRKFRFSDDLLFDMRYRDIHLGDFIHEKRHNRYRKMCSFIKKSTLRAYLKLKQTKNWKQIADFSNKDTVLRVMLRRLDKHCSRRLGI